MNINDKYPTLEQSKRIVELLGESAPESQMVWEQVMFFERAMDIADGVWRLTSTHRSFLESFFPAYDLAELGEMIVVHWGHTASNLQHPIMLTEYYRDSALWNVNAMNGESFPTEAQARAALLIHLLEQKQ